MVFLSIYAADTDTFSRRNGSDAMTFSRAVDMRPSEMVNVFKAATGNLGWQVQSVGQLNTHTIGSTRITVLPNLPRHEDIEQLSHEVMKDSHTEWILTEKLEACCFGGFWSRYDGAATKAAHYMLEAQPNYSFASNRIKIITFFDYSDKKGFGKVSRLGDENIVRFVYKCCFNNWCISRGKGIYSAPGVPIFLLCNEYWLGTNESTIEQCVVDYQSRLINEDSPKNIGTVSCFNVYRGPLKYIYSRT